MYVHTVVIHQKYLMRMGEFIIVKPWREYYHFFQLSMLPNSPDFVGSLLIQETKPDHHDRLFKNPDLTKKII